MNPSDIQDAQKHTVYLLTFMITSAIYLNFVKNDNQFEQKKWAYQTIAMIFGAIMYDLILNKLNKFIETQLDITDVKFKKALGDIVLWTTIFISLEFMDAYLDNRQYNTSSLFIKEKATIILGYVIYDLFLEEVVRTTVQGSNQDLVSDITKNLLALTAAVYVKNGNLTHMSGPILVSISFVVYHLFTKFFVVKPEIVKS